MALAMELFLAPPFFIAIGGGMVRNEKEAVPYSGRFPVVPNPVDSSFDQKITFYMRKRYAKVPSDNLRVYNGNGHYSLDWGGFN